MLSQCSGSPLDSHQERAEHQLTKGCLGFPGDSDIHSQSKCFPRTAREEVPHKVSSKR